MISVPSSFATHTLGASMHASSFHCRPEAADAGAAGTDGRWSRLPSAVPATQRQPDRWPTSLLTSCWSVRGRCRQGRAFRCYRRGTARRQVIKDSIPDIPDGWETGEAQAFAGGADKCSRYLGDLAPGGVQPALTSPSVV